MSTLKSPNVANLDSSPPVHPDVSQLGGRVRIACGTLPVPIADADSGDIILLERLPVNCVPLSIMIFNETLDSASSLTVDVGVYDNAATAAAKDANVFATLVTTFQSDNFVGVDMIVEAGDAAMILYGQKLWEWAGDSTDPGGLYHIALTIVTVAGTQVAGDISWRILYSID